MHPVIVVIVVFTVISFVASVLLLATLALSSRISQEEGIEETCPPEEVDVSGQITRFPHGR